MRARCRRSLVWASPLLLLGLLVVGGRRSAAADVLWFAADDAACADAGESAEAADLMAFEDPQGAAAAPATPATPAEPAAAPGKPCTTNGQCPKKDYCAKPNGDCKGKGECKVKPRICPLDWLPVCGCNGKTYGNSCWAAMAGVNVKSDGPCEKAVKCKTNADCGNKADFCHKPDGKCDDEGICAPRPVFCPADIVDPVCGCNDKTYGNRCLAFHAGVDVKHTGKCEK